ncbi:carboxypeptidase regulatory-like domain-containing protein [Thalassobacillus pellis]|uniref:carboxypeptidase regulatory-like domain-containing protein n=1 Tax=Thalassobacillus pellis TaxID=748008 RepID=UPI00195F4C29|nr:carboxypeptidase regulatory-like domain-containing protein [Thalassobacillus pellis]MBM7553900.1 protocatechuate 3,4-dioxygenase beta subunit [Thalassobacillus pellis]
MPFPDNTQYTPIQVNGSPIFDLVGDESPVSTDIVGNSTFPAAFFAYDGSNVYFRIRLNGDPRNAQLTAFRNFSWGILINTQGEPGTYDWLFNVDGLNNRLSLVRNVNKQVNSWNDPAEGTGGGNPNFAQPITNFDYARVTPANSNFGGSPDFFLDWFLPASTVFSFLGINESTLLRSVIFSSANTNNYNKDSLRTEEGFQFADALSDPVSPADVDVRAELTVSKTLTSGPSTVLLGQEAFWTGRIIVTNTGLSPANTIFLEDVLGPDIINAITVTSVTQGLTVYNSRTQSLTWNVGNLTAGQNAVLIFSLNGAYTNDGSRALDSVQASGFDNFTGSAIQSNTAAIPITVQSTAAVVGTIFDQATGLVLSGATVRLLQGATEIAITSTNGNGIYTFTGISPGNYTVEVSRPDYQMESVNVTAIGGSSTTANLSLSPLPSTITGNVSNGGPIQNAEVRLTNLEGILIASDTTDTAGDYSFTGLVPEQYQISVMAPGFQSQVTATVVAPNQTYTVNFVLLGNPGSITGQIQDSATNTPIPNATVELLTQTGVFIASVTSDATGNYTFGNLSAGNYLVRATAVNYASSTVSTIVTAGNTTVTDILLQANPGTVTGTVRDGETNAPLPGAVIQVLNSQNVVVAATTADAGGVYTVDQLKPGFYTLVFSANGYSNITIGAEISPNGITVVDAELSRLAGALAGTVQNGSGGAISGGLVSVFQNNILITTAVTDGDGNYFITGLAPGNYTVVISAEGFSTNTSAAAIENGQITELNVVLEENPGTLSGSVFDSSSNPVAGASITVQLSSGSGIVIATTVTASDGSYTMEGLAPGNYSVVASADNLQSAVQGVTIVSNLVSNLDFNLEPNPGSLAGQIVNVQTGTPITSANVEVRIIDTSGAIIASVVTDQNGQYVVNQLAPGVYTVIVSAENFQTGIATFQVNSNQTTAGNMALSPSPGQIAGNVVTLGGAPIQGATVSVANSNGSLITTVLTDENGLFFVDGLAPDQYTLTVFAANFQNSQAGAFVTAGQTTPVEVTLLPNPGSITGVVDPVVPNTIIQLRNANNVLIDSVTANADGTFRFNNLAPELYIVSASAPNFSTVQTGTLVEASQTSQVALTMTANPASVSGRVTDNDGNPVPEATVQVLDLNGVLIATGFANAEGNYTIGNLPVGTFTVVANAPSFGQVITGIDLEPGEELANINFVLVPNPGSINGQITNLTTGNPIEGATVTILDGISQLPVSVTTTTLFGNYTVSGLSPGPYIVTASRTGFGTGQLGAFVLSDTTVTADIALTPNPGTITGTVVDTNGDPITDTRIQVGIYDENNILVVSLLANSDGTYTVPGLAPGGYFVVASAPNFSSSIASAFVESGQTINVTNILVPDPVTLSVTVTNASTGLPVEGAAVTVRDENSLLIISGITDQNGTVTLTSLPSGILNVTADAAGFGTETQTFIAGPGEEINALFTLDPNPGNIQGFITNIQTGDAVPNAAILLYDINNVLVQTAVSNQFGEYFFTGVTPGVYTVVANAADFGPATAGAIVEAEVTTTLSFALSPNPGLIQGFVRDAQDNSPIPGANVIVRELSGSGPIIYTTLTDQDGFFQTTSLSPNVYVLVAVNAEGYGANSVSAEVISNNVTNTEILLSRNPGTLQGTVRDASTASPLPGTLIRVIDNQGTIVAGVQTDISGFYLIDSLKEGIYTVTAINPDYQAGIQTIEIAANDTTTLDFSLEENPATLSGTVTDFLTGAPLTGVIIEVRLGGTDILVRRTLTDENGNYLLEGLPSGTFDVVAQLTDYSIFVSTVVLSPTETEILDIVLTPSPATIQGTVVDAVTGNPISGALVTVVIPNTDIIVATIITGSDGTYTIGNLPNGNFDVVFSAQDFGNVVIPVILSPNETETINVSLTPDTATLLGVVSDRETEEPIEDALVRVFDLSGTFITSSLTDSTGQYIFTNLAPGTYTLIASAEGYGNEVGAVTLTVDEVEFLDFALLQQSASLSGTVRDASNGQPISTVLVQVFRIGTDIPVASVLSDENGAYDITGLEPREYRVVYSKENYSREVFRILLENGEDRTLDVLLERNAASIRGQVVDSQSGTPITRANVTLVIRGSGIIVAAVETDPNGNYLLQSLPPGNYDLIFSREGYVTETRQVTLSKNEDLLINVALEPNPATITGNVSSAETMAPIENALIQIFSANGTFLGETLTNSEGNYQITGLPSGTFILIVRASGHQASFRTITLSSGEIAEENFLLQGNPASISGFVTDVCNEAPIVQALVQIFPEGLDVPIRSTLTDVDGFYTLTGLPPGVFQVRFSAEGYPSEEHRVELEENEELILNVMLGELTLICPDDIIVPNDLGMNGAVVEFPPPTITGCREAETSCSPASGSFFPVGSTTVTCSATDAAGSVVTCSFIIRVVMDPCRYLNGS